MSGRVRLAGFLAQSHTGGDIVSTDRLHPLAQQFDAAAQAYARGRPDYGPAVAGAIASELRLTAGGKVLDLAAGTGRLTRGLIEIGLDVVAIEPLPALREILAQSVGEARVADGVAEAIPLADGSVAAVTVAEAFHWFDLPPALAEIRRVLAPGGGLAGLSSFPDWGGASWAHEVGTIIAEARPEHPQFDRPAWHAGLAPDNGWTAPREINLTDHRPATPELIRDQANSISWIAALPDDRREETLSRIERIVGEGDTPAELPFHTSIVLTERLDTR